MTPFQEGKEYRRRALHEVFGGQQQGGISTPADHPYIFLFIRHTGEKYGYDDQWQSNDLLHYVGEGQHGDQEFIRGNRAIRDHQEDGKTLHFFQYIRQGYVEYIGEMVYEGHHWEQAPDVTGQTRQVIVFELRLK